MELSYTSAKSAMEGLVLAGAAIMAILYGLKRVYTSARMIDELLSLAKKNESQRLEVADQLAVHIQGQEAREEIRDRQIADLTAKVNIIFREVLPNGGSSMRDVVNQTNLRVAVLEQWKNDNGG